MAWKRVAASSTTRAISRIHSMPGILGQEG
jgi:hypothetical protein